MVNRAKRSLRRGRSTPPRRAATRADTATMGGRGTRPLCGGCRGIAGAAGLGERSPLARAHRPRPQAALRDVRRDEVGISRVARSPTAAAGWVPRPEVGGVVVGDRVAAVCGVPADGVAIGSQSGGPTASSDPVTGPLTSRFGGAPREIRTPNRQIRSQPSPVPTRPPGLFASLLVLVNGNVAAPIRACVPARHAWLVPLLVRFALFSGFGSRGRGGPRPDRRATCGLPRGLSTPA
jgi:hypothetical protein